MIGTPITITNHDTGESIVLNDHITDEENVIALQSFPSLETDVRAQNQPKQGAHGEFRLPYYYSGKSIVLQGVIVGQDGLESAVWDLKRDFDRIMSLSPKGYGDEGDGSAEFPPMFRNTVRLSFTTPDGKNVFIDATPIKPVSYDRPLQQRYMLNFQVILRSNFPYLVVLDDSPNIVAGSLGSITNGLQIPFQIPFSFEENVTGEITISMEDPGFAVVTMNGSDDGVIVNPKITNLTNGSFVKINRSILGSQKYFKIDGLYQKMTDQNGDSVQQYSEGDFIRLEAGDNSLVYTADHIIPN